MSRSDQDRLAKIAGDSIRFVPAYAHMLDNVKAGLMLSQLVYWHGMGKRFDGYFYKSVSEFERETGLTRHEQEKAVQQLKTRGLIDIKRAGIPATRTFWVYIDKVEHALTTWQESIKQDEQLPVIQFAEKRPTNTETTHKTTAEISKDYDLNHPSFRQAEAEGTGLQGQ